MRTLLFVMNARAMPECIDSFCALDVDIAWATGYTVAELVEVHAEVVRTHGDDYDVISVCSDDCIVSQDALDAVLNLMEAGAPAATGWCRMRQGSHEVNLTRSALRGDRPVRSAYPFFTYDEVVGWPDEAIPTGFMGMSFTTLTTDLWRQIPYGCFTYREPVGHSSDFALSMRLRDAYIPMLAAREGYIDHRKLGPRGSTPGDPAADLIVGKVEPHWHIDTAADRLGVPA